MYIHKWLDLKQHRDSINFIIDENGFFPKKQRKIRYFKLQQIHKTKIFSLKTDFKDFNLAQMDQKQAHLDNIKIKSLLREIQVEQMRSGDRKFQNFQVKEQSKQMVIVNFTCLKESLTKMVKSKKLAACSLIPSFIDKLCLILDDDSCSEFIDWTQSQDSFSIKDINRFTDTVLPKYFKHCNFSSFIRQLNMYGFNKIRHDQGENVYKNDNFKRNQRNLLKNIKRKVNPTERQDKLMLYQPSKNLNKQLSQLKTRQINLESMCHRLITQNNRILEENNAMMKKLSQNQKQKNKKIEEMLMAFMQKGNSDLLLSDSESGGILSLTNGKNSRINPKNKKIVNFQQFFEGNCEIEQLERAFGISQKSYENKKEHRGLMLMNSEQNLQNQDSLILNHHESLPQYKHPELPNLDDENSMLSLSDFFNIEDPIDPSQPLI